MTCPRSPDRPSLGRLCLRGRAAAAARRARSARGHGRLDRHLPRRAAAHAAGHVRLPHRQRRRRAGGRQPAASRHQPRPRRAARADRAVPDGRSTRSSTACRTPNARTRTAFRRWSSSAATRLVGIAALRRARVAAAGACSASAISTLALGGWANPHADPERQVDFLTDDRLQRRVLSDAGREPPPRRRASSVHRGGRAARTGSAGRVRRVLLPQRQSANAGRAEGIPAGARRGADAGVRRAAPRPRMSARERFERCSTPARAISTSATCRSDARRLS